MVEPDDTGTPDSQGIFFYMRDRVAHTTLRSSYLYASERLLGEVYKKARSSAGPMSVTGLSAGIPGTGLSASVGPNPDQPDNIYWLGDLAARTVPKFTVGKRPRGSVPAYLHAVVPLTWTILRVSDIAKPVAWMYADWHDFRGGRTVLALCGSVTNYRDLRPDTDNGTDLGWYPSSAMGLEAIMRAMAEGREADVRSDMETADRMAGAPERAICAPSMIPAARSGSSRAISSTAWATLRLRLSSSTLFEPVEKRISDVPCIPIRRKIAESMRSIAVPAWLLLAKTA
jgi:hypothetical protein